MRMWTERSTYRVNDMVHTTWCSCRDRMFSWDFCSLLSAVSTHFVLYMCYSSKKSARWCGTLRQQMGESWVDGWLSCSDSLWEPIPSILINVSWGHALDCSSKTNFQLYWHRFAMETILSWQMPRYFSSVWYFLFLPSQSPKTSSHLKCVTISAIFS